MNIHTTVEKSFPKTQNNLSFTVMLNTNVMLKIQSIKLN